MAEGNTEYYSACDACRIRKFKCTKERPACIPCLQLNHQCNYSQKVSRTPLTRTNLTAAEDRIRDLEAAFTTLFPGIDLDTLLSSTKSENSVGPSSRNLAQSAKKLLFGKQEQEQENRGWPASSASESLPREADGFDWSENAVRLSELSDGMAALAINPEGAGYLGATSSVIPLRALLNKERGVSAGFPDPGACHIQSLLSQQIPLFLPENTFVDAYFRYYHPTYPFLYEPLFRAQFEGKSPRPEGSWPILLNAVLALGAWCIGEDDSVMDDYFDQKFSDSRSMFESGNLAMVQALLLLSNYTQKRNRPNTGWNYLGLAVRMALSLGLHREFPNWEISMLQREIRRRVWWGLWIFDSGASITFGRPVLLPQRGIMDACQVLNIEEESLTAQTTSLPAEVSKPTVYTPLICQSLFHIATNGLHHRLISTPGPTPQELLALHKTIDAWKESIPSYFKLDHPDVQSNENLLFARYRLSWRTWDLKILLSRPVVLQHAARMKSLDPNASSETSEEFECRKICTRSASATISSISEFMSKGIVSRLSTWYMLYFLFQAGLVPVVCLNFDITTEESSMWLNDILITKDLLSRMAITNRLAARCLALFKRLSPLFEPDVPEDLELWEGTYTAGFLGDQLGEGFWDWANSEMNWTT